MTLQETNKILAIVCEVYPLFLKDRNPEATATIWQRMFSDEPYEYVEKGLMAFIATDTKGFAPSIGAIKEQIAQLSSSTEMTEMEAWSLVLKAISRGLYNSTEEFNKLPPSIQSVVGSPEQIHEWAMMDADDVHTVVSSNFQRSYRARSENERKYGMLPESLRINLPKGEPVAIGDIYSNLKVIEGGKA